MEFAFYALKLFGFFIAAILLHELGHIVAMLVVGLRIEKVSIGHGKKVFSLGWLEFCSKMNGMGVTVNGLNFNELSRHGQCFILISGFTANFLAASLFLFNHVFFDFSATNLAVLVLGNITASKTNDIVRARKVWNGQIAYVKKDEEATHE
jgi:hypothetical protein